MVRRAKRLNKSDIDILYLLVNLMLRIHIILTYHRLYQPYKKANKKMGNIFKSIFSELDRINHPSWINAIEILENNFDGYPVDDDSQKPAAAILEILKNLAPDDSVEDRFIYRVKQLDCFTYRSFHTDKDNNAVYWNPLKEKYMDFSEKRSIQYQADMEYPATDIISKWLKRRITA